MSTFALFSFSLIVAVCALLFALYLQPEFDKMNATRDEFYYEKFPQDFKWGLASSAYQTEGGWDLDGKGESIWDRYCHQNPDKILDKSNGDIACDSIHKWKEDVQLLKNIGAKMYRFSIAWARILPKGNPEEVNEPGVDFYNKLINELLAHGIEPVATLYHWDLPQALEDQGGWLNEDVVTRFGEFARICYAKFGDRVQRWITINEPFTASWASYDVGFFAPGRGEPGVSVYISVQNMLKAHAVAYHIYHDEFRARQKGFIGISLESFWFEPADPNKEEDRQASERALQFQFGITAHPILKGDYPPIVKQCIADKSKAEGRAQSRLPVLDQVWIQKITGTYDFIGLNHYSTELVQAGEPSDEIGWASDQYVKKYFDQSWQATGIDWQKVVPWGLRKLLNWIKNEYGNIEIMITENGMGGDASDTVEDTQRAEFFRSYLNEVLKAIKLDGCNVTGYFGWCLMDVFEWHTGYTLKFGVHHVDFNDPERKRTPKASAKALSIIFKENGFQQRN